MKKLSKIFDEFQNYLDIERDSFFSKLEFAMKYFIKNTLKLAAILNITAIAILLIACATAASSHYGGGDGSSKEKAVVIKGARNTLDGIRLESEWLAKTYPGYKKMSVSTPNENDKVFDEITIKTKSGEEKIVFFDITEFYGKW